MWNILSTIGLKMNKIFNYLDELFENPICELEFNKDYELLIATVLSAQTTDKRVNKVTRVLFKKYPSIEALSNASVKDIESIEWYGIKDHDTREEIDDAILDCCYKYCEENNITDFEESFLKRM